MSFLLCNSSDCTPLHRFPYALFVPRLGNVINKYSLDNNNKTTQGRAEIRDRAPRRPVAGAGVSKRGSSFLAPTYNLSIYLDVFVGLLYVILCSLLAALLPYCDLAYSMKLPQLY